MAYSTANSPYVLVQGIAGGLISTSTSVTAGFGNIWAMRTTDVVGTWMADNYISNATALGMKKYDIVYVLGQASTTFHCGIVSAISSGYGTVGILVSTSSA
jgi:hypothetical protein